MQGTVRQAPPSFLQSPPTSRSKYLAASQQKSHRVHRSAGLILSDFMVKAGKISHPVQ